MEASEHICGETPCRLCSAHRTCPEIATEDGKAPTPLSLMVNVVNPDLPPEPVESEDEEVREETKDEYLWE